ncbi:hypothetical protein ACI65C_000935 [Semiaphis heraclei]
MSRNTSKRNLSSSSSFNESENKSKLFVTPNRYASLSVDADSSPKVFSPPPVKSSPLDHPNIPAVNMESSSTTKIQTPPFYDRIKILLQAHNKRYANFGVFSGLAEIVKRESFFALHKGNGAQMLLRPIFGNGSHIGKFVAGSSAGVTAVTISYPLDTIRARLAFQVTGEHVYNGIIHTAKSIIQNEGGVKALYRGFVPTLCGMVPYAGLTFFCFESIKKFCLKTLPTWFSKPSDKDSGGAVLTIPAKLLCGGLSGALAQCVSYPLDVTRRRMQLSSMDNNAKYGHGMIKTLVTVYRTDGITNGLYRGISINIIRAVPIVAVSFSTYELMKQTLHLDTGPSEDTSDLLFNGQTSRDGYKQEMDLFVTQLMGNENDGEEINDLDLEILENALNTNEKEIERKILENNILDFTQITSNSSLQNIRSEMNDSVSRQTEDILNMMQL